LSLAANAWQNVPPAPGRPAGPQAQSAPAAPAVGAPGDAGAPPPPSPGAIGWFPFLLLIPFVLLLIFSSRSQQKKQQKMLAELKKGDRVLTSGGMVGKLVELGDRYAKVEIAPGVKIEVVKNGLLGRDTAEAAATMDKK
jgi:preprotein translocase subunit YajC